MASGSRVYVLFNVVDETHQDDLAELAVPLTRSGGRALDGGVGCFSH